MDDLISRQALRSEMYHEAFEKDSDEQRWDGGCWIRYKMFERVVDRQPPAQPKKGRWISADAMFHGVPFYCSECGENTRDTVMGKPRWKFCPMCGAKMEVTE